MPDVSSSDHPKEHAPFAPLGSQVAWGPIASVMITVLTFFATQTLAAFVLAAVLGGGERAEEWFLTTAGQFYFVLLSDAFTLLAIWMFLRGRGGSFKQLGLAKKPSWRGIGYALLMYLAYYFVLLVVIIAAGALTPINLEQKQELGFEQLWTLESQLMAFAGLVIMAPIVEEIVFRGFVFAGMRKKLPFIWATAFTSLLFAAPHLMQSSEGILWIAGIDTLLLSFALCYLREKTGALWAPILLHALKNSMAFIIMVSSAS